MLLSVASKRCSRHYMRRDNRLLVPSMQTCHVSNSRVKSPTCATGDDIIQQGTQQFLQGTRCDSSRQAMPICKLSHELLSSRTCPSLCRLFLREFTQLPAPFRRRSLDTYVVCFRESSSCRATLTSHQATFGVIIYGKWKMHNS